MDTATPTSRRNPWYVIGWAIASLVLIAGIAAVIWVTRTHPIPTHPPEYWTRTLADGTTIELLSIAFVPPKSDPAWRPDGTVLDPSTAPDPPGSTKTQPLPRGRQSRRRLAYRVQTGRADAARRLQYRIGRHGSFVDVPMQGNNMGGGEGYGIGASGSLASGCSYEITAAGASPTAIDEVAEIRYQTCDIDWEVFDDVHLWPNE